MPNRKPTGLPPGPRHNFGRTAMADPPRRLTLKLTRQGWEALNKLRAAYPGDSMAKIIADALEQRLKLKGREAQFTWHESAPPKAPVAMQDNIIKPI